VNDIRLKRKSGSGPLYFSTSAAFFSQENLSRPLETSSFRSPRLFQAGAQTDASQRLTYERQPLNDGETVNSGDESK